MEVLSLVPSPRISSFIETRLDLDAIEPASLVASIQIPSTSAFSLQSRPIVKRVTERLTSKDEAAFHKHNAATATAVFFRAGRTEEHGYSHPRTIAWRVVDAGSTLEVRALDLLRPDSQPDWTKQVLRFTFASAIRTGGVAFAETASESAISAFIMTKNHELYTLTLRPSFFSLPLPTVEDIESAFYYFRPSALSISTFYKIFAPSPLLLFVSLGDGRLTQLSRTASENGSQWLEKTLDDGQWVASFRGLLPWHARPTAQFEGSTLNLKTVHAAALSPTQEHVFTTGLDHTLKAWNLSNGKPAIIRDLLGQPIPEDGISKTAIDPGTPRSLRLFESRSGGGYMYYAMTFSPQRSGLFKIWSITDADDAEAGIRDSFDTKELRLPDPGDGALWTLSDFEVLSSTQASEIEIWILMRLNRRFQLFHRRFHDINDLGEAWESGWLATIVHPRQIKPPVSLGDKDGDHSDLTTRWLNHIKEMTHVSQKVLETSLSVYLQSKNERPKASNCPLPERIVATILARTVRPSNLNGNSSAELMDSAKKEWSNFWNIVQDVDNSRWEPMSLALDSVASIPWIAFADGVSIIRECSDLELVAHNEAENIGDHIFSRVIPSIEESEPVAVNKKEQAIVVDAASAFRSSFAPRLRHSCLQAIDQETWKSPNKSPADRLQDLYDQCDFAEEVTSRQFEDLRGSLQEVGGFPGLRAFHFLVVSDSHHQRFEPDTSFSNIGLAALACGALDLSSLQLRTLQDLLCLLVFIFGELDPAEELAEALEAEQTFLALIKQLKKTELALWLATRTRAVDARASNDLPSESESHSVSVLRDLFAPDLKPYLEELKDGQTELTQGIQHLLSWVAGDNGEASLDDAIVSIQCYLLSKRNIDLAISFERFLPSTAWSCYAQGRLRLMQANFSEAATFLRHAAYRLSRPHPPSLMYEEMSHGLLDANEAALFASGLSRYYAHISGLFQNSNAHVHTMAFAQLALQNMHGTSAGDDLLPHTLQCLFRSALAVSQFDIAATALNRMHNQSVQQSALRDFLARIVECGAIRDLLRLPFPNLQKEIDSLLAERARQEGLKGTIGPQRIPYFRVLYAWRLRVGDIRGAAAVLIERLEASKQHRSGQNPARGLGAAGLTKRNEQALDEYLVAINALALVGEQQGTGASTGEEGWVFVESTGKPRRVVRLQDLRTAYGEEMDHQGMLQMGRFGIVDPDEDEEMDLQS